MKMKIQELAEKILDLEKQHLFQRLSLREIGKKLNYSHERIRQVKMSKEYQRLKAELLLRLSKN